MLVNCPRCGFSQPKDQYCAKCGVDMVSYKPQKAPIVRRLITHPASFIVVLILSIYLGYSLTQSFKGRSHPLSKSNLHSFLSQKSLNPDEAENYREALSAAEDESTKESSLQSTKKSALNPKNETLSKKSISFEKEVQITFYEVKTDALFYWMDRQTPSEKFVHTDEYSLATLPHFSQIKKSFLEFSRPLDHLSKDTNLKETSRLDFFYGVSIPEYQNTRVGHRFYMVFQPLSENEATLHGELFLQRYWYLRSGRTKQNYIEHPQQDTIKESLNLEPDSVFMVIGSLPRETPPEVALKLEDSPVYKLLKTDNFQKKLTDLVILIEIHDLRKDKSVDSSPQM